MKYNLRFFNTDAEQDNQVSAGAGENTTPENNGGADDSAEGDSNDDAGVAAEKTVTMTQKELDATIAARLARERSKMPSKERLKAFDEWENNQKTESEKVTEKLGLLEQAQREKEELSRQVAAMKKGVNPDLADYAIFEAAKRVDDSTDFDTALDAVLEEKKDMFAPKQKAKDTGMYQSKTPAAEVDYQTQHANAIKAGKMAEAVAIKRKAHAEGIIF